MKYILISILVTVGAFLFFSCCISYMNRSLGSHSSFECYSGFKYLNSVIYVIQHDEKSLPDATRVNRIIAEHFQKAPNHELFENYSDKDHMLFQLPQLISENRSLRMWDSPPIYVRDETLPEGFGFYLEGEDGISNTAGEDADDVNSWDRKSNQFYAQREILREKQRDASLAMIPTGFVILWLFLRRQQ